MKNSDFGHFIRSIREEKGIPQRLVAQQLNIDTSTLSKIELGERHLSIAMIPPLADVLDLDFKQLQIKFISQQILETFDGQPFFIDALKTLVIKIQK
jgi:transcriptional regulator with XRE-family HTH domain